MAAINCAQLIKAKMVAEGHGHMKAGEVLGRVADLPPITVKGGEGQEPTKQILANKKSKEALQGLDNIHDDYEGTCKERK